MYFIRNNNSRSVIAKQLLACSSAIALTVAFGVLTAENAAAQDAVETVVVSGIRESLQSAMDIKRNNIEVVDSIVAEDIGKLPDSNVAETMTRIPGVQGYRYGGEGASPVGIGSGLTIRGLSGQTASRVDEHAYFTAGEREFNIEDAIPGMVAGIDVYKNPGADHIEGGIGGLVNIRLRKPLDFNGETFSAAVNGRYNDMVGKVKPEYFGLYANRWSLKDLGEVGILLAANYQTSQNRSDNNPSGAGAAIYVPTANANGTYSLVSGTTSSSASESVRNAQVSFAGISNNINQEDILRTRIGYQAAAQWKPNAKWDVYLGVNYNYYLYHQKYRFLVANNTTTVKNLTTESTDQVNELLVNRNANGGANEILAGQKVKNVTYVGDTFTSTGGMEYHPYRTQMVNGGANWHPNDDLEVRFDAAMVNALVTDDNRSVAMKTKNGETWNVTYNMTTSPHKITIEGDSLADPNNWVFSNYSNGTNTRIRDTGYASTLDAKYTPHWDFITAIKAGFRVSSQYERGYAWSGNAGYLTTNGKALDSTYSNAISVATTGYQQLTEKSATNWMEGDAGYSGGFLTYDPDKLSGDQVLDKFSDSGILANDALSEVLTSRRYAREVTYGGYAMAEYALWNGLFDGNFGVRLVSATDTVQAMVAYASGTGYYTNKDSSSEFDALPSFNLNFNVADDFKIKFGYGKGMMRPSLSDLNPSISVSTSAGTGSMGNASLSSEKADSYDLSFEKYFGNGAYIALGLFDKEITGFFTSISRCMTVDLYGDYTGSTDNGCSNGQWYVTQTVNTGDGYARGVELSGQTFFDFLPGIWSKFGAMLSLSYVDASSQVALTAGKPMVYLPLPFQSRYSGSASLLYEDGDLSGRLVYTYRSSFVFSSVSAYPMNDRVVHGYGLLDLSLNYNLIDNIALNFNISNLTNAAPNRYIGEPGGTDTDFERQHYMNGRIYGFGLRFRTGD